MNGFIHIFGLFIFYCFYIIFRTHSQISFFSISFFGRTFPRLMSKLDITTFPRLCQLQLSHALMSKLDIRTFPRSVVQIGHHKFPTPCCPNWTLELSHALLSNLDIRIFPRSISLVFQHIILPHSTNRNIHRQTKPNIATVYKHLLFPTPTLDLTWSIYRWVSFDMY